MRILVFSVCVCRSEETLAAAQQACQELTENLRRVTQDKQNFDFKTAAELDDLYRTKINLEERLVELIRYKIAIASKPPRLCHLWYTVSLVILLHIQICLTVLSAGRKMHYGRRRMLWSLSRNCGMRRQRGMSTTVWAVTVSSAGGSASITAG